MDNYNVVENFFDFCLPGLYQITCTRNNKIYFGETNNCCYRLGHHFTDLNNNTHHCKALLSDFKKYGATSFKATIIEMGPHLQDTERRKKRETEHIASITPDLCYNVIDVDDRKPVYKSYQYLDRTFHTINELRLFINKTEKTNYSETHFRRLFISPHGMFSNKVQFVKTRPQTDMFLVDNQIFYGWRDIVAKNLAKNKRQVFYRLTSANWPSFQYFKKTKNRVGFKSKNLGFVINGKFYPTTKSIVDANLAKDIYQASYRLRSSSERWKNWYIKKS